jgi:hypothetical protein
MLTHSHYLRRLRCFLLLALSDSESGTGIRAGRISEIERGLVAPNEAERTALERFYLARFRMTVAGDEEESANLSLRR